MKGPRSFWCWEWLPIAACVPISPESILTALCLSRSSKLNFLILPRRKRRKRKWPLGVFTHSGSVGGRAASGTGRDPLINYRESNVSSLHPPPPPARREKSFLASAALPSLVTSVVALGCVYSTSQGLDHSIWPLIMHWQLPFSSSFVLTPLNPRGSWPTDSIWI